MAQQKKFYGWFLLMVLSTIIFINMALSLYGGSVMNAVMAKELKLDRSMLGLGFTAFLLAQGFFGPLIALATNRFGARRTIFIGCIVLSIGAFLMATVVSQGWHYVIIYGAVVALGMGLSTSIPIQTVVTFWFDARRAFALSIAWAAAGVGGFVVAPVLNSVITAAGGDWRAGWYLTSVAALATAGITLAFVRNTPADIGQVAEGKFPQAGKEALTTAKAQSGKTTHRTTAIWDLRDAFRTPANWIIMFSAIAFGLPVTAVLAHGVSHLRDIGHSQAVAAMALGMLALTSVVGKLLGGYLADRVEPRYVWSTAMIMIGIGVLLLVRATSEVEIYIFAALVGAGQGASIICRSMLVGNYFGPKTFAAMLGMQAPIVTVVAAAAPYLAGLSHNLLHSYTLIFYVLASISFCGGVLVLFARPPRIVVPTAVGMT